MRPLLRPVASRSWYWPNLKRCHSMLTQRLCFSGTEEPNAKPQTMSPQSMICSRGSPATSTTWPSLFWWDKRRGLDALVPSPPWPTELLQQRIKRKKLCKEYVGYFYSRLFLYLKNRAIHGIAVDMLEIHLSQTTVRAFIGTQVTRLLRGTRFLR